MASDDSPSWLQQIQDPILRQALRFLHEDIRSSRGSAGAGGQAKIRSNLDAQRNRLTNVGAPTSSLDAVNKSYADSNYGAAALQRALSGEGASPLDVSDLRGRLAQPQNPRVVLIPNGNPLPPPEKFEPYSMILSGTDGFFYFMDPAFPPGVWTPIVPGVAPSTPGGGGGGTSPGGSRCGGASNSPDCPRLCAGGQYAGAVTGGQDAAEAENPDLFENPGEHPLVIKVGSEQAYRSAVVGRINDGGYGVAAQNDPNSDSEIVVVTTVSTPTFSEHYAIYASSREPRSPPGAYRATCTPSRFV